MKTEQKLLEFMQKEEVRDGKCDGEECDWRFVGEGTEAKRLKRLKHRS
jgi:hypothetical protein